MSISKLARRCLRAQGWRWSYGDHKRKAGVYFHPEPIGQAIVQLVTGDSDEEVEARNNRTQAWLESVVEAGKGRKVAS